MDRRLCLRCRQPAFSCFCAHIEELDPRIKFVILIHPIEARRRIATGRMSHLALKSSTLIEGHDFSENEKVNALLDDPFNHCMILYPGHLSTNITPMSPVERSDLIPSEKQLVIFVIDGTWGTARKMAHLSKNLHRARRICFTPPAPSRFRVRKQPREGCYSTIEAIHHAIELLGETQGFDVRGRGHDKLLKLFDVMVEQQLGLMKGKQVLRENWQDPDNSFRRTRRDNRLIVE